jgi:DMSO/TMAO reductase YedYZ molybdopterin-dependent catalytic subunit
MQNPFIRKSEEERFQKEGRLPPGQALTQKFPVLHYGPVPRFNPETWDFKMWGEVEKPLQLSWSEF